MEEIRLNAYGFVLLLLMLHSSKYIQGAPVPRCRGFDCTFSGIAVSTPWQSNSTFPIAVEGMYRNCSPQCVVDELEANYQYTSEDISFNNSRTAIRKISVRSFQSGITFSNYSATAGHFSGHIKIVKHVMPKNSYYFVQVLFSSTKEVLSESDVFYFGEIVPRTPIGESVSIFCTNYNPNEHLTCGSKNPPRAFIFTQCEILSENHTDVTVSVSSGFPNQYGCTAESTNKTYTIVPELPEQNTTTTSLPTQNTSLEFQNDSDSIKTTLIAFGVTVPAATVVLCILLVIPIGILLLYVCCNRKYKTERCNIPRPQCLHAYNSNYRSFIPEIPSEMLDIQDLLVIGSGQFGSVVSGHLKQECGRKEVAIKTVCGQSKDAVLEEARMMCLASMPEKAQAAIVQCLGVCSRANLMMIVTEKAPGRDLAHFLLNRSTTYDDRKALPIVLKQVCSGMLYLSSEMKIVHRDVACRNLLVFSWGDVISIKIGDFGLAVQMKPTSGGNCENLEYCFIETQKNLKIPYRTVSPEVITENLWSQKSDAWAFGVTAWEVFSGARTPYDGICEKVVLRKLATKQIHVPTYLECPDGCPDQLYDIYRQCWKVSCQERPSFDALDSQIQHYLSSKHQTIFESTV